MMSLLHAYRVCCPLVLPALVLLTVVVGGCDRPEKAPVLEESRTVAAETLPELGGLIGPLDEGRIEVAPPAGWHVPPRNRQWLIRFTALQNLSYPSILLTAEDYETVFNVTDTNVDEFARQISAALSKDTSTARLSQGIEPIKIGSLVGITYRRRAQATYKSKKIELERLFIETVVSGRKYTLELRTRTGTLDKYRSSLEAVAGGMKFLHAEETPETEGLPELDEPL
ncbi:MAG: hypothetical protein JXB62_00155 [Pirellulales bacterium]|nr:hypothetical protein [Pirellulales bacterium]